MRNYIVLGVSDRTSAVRLAVFGDVVHGSVPNARYLSFSALCGLDDPLHRLLLGGKLRRLFGRWPAMLSRLNRAADASFQRHMERPRGRRLRAHGYDANTDFIFCPSTALRWAGEPLLRALRRACPTSRMLFYLVDGVERTALVNRMTEDALLAYLRSFDGAYTYDRSDALRCPGLRYVDIPLWHSRQAPPAEPEWDLYFCGRDKGRGELLRALRDRLEGTGVRFHARVTDVRRPAQAGSGAEVAPSAWVPYEETVSEILRSGCILEILASHNRESTLRYKEAVIYNKKLLTNNPGIVDLPYYDPRWMRVFRTAGDVDPDWLRAAEPVDYGYRGDYSAQNFLKTIDELASRQEPRP